MKLIILLCSFFFTGCSHHANKLNQSIDKQLQKSNLDYIIFESKYLQHLLSIQSQYNHEILISRNEIEKKKLVLLKGIYDKSLNLNYSLSSSSSKDLSKSGHSTNNNSSGLGLSYTFDLFQKEDKIHESVFLNNMSFLHSHLSLRTRISAQLIKEYINLLNINEKTRKFELIVHINTELLKMKKKEVALGASTKDTLYDVEYALFYSKLLLNNAIKQRSNLIKNIPTLLGKEVNIDLLNLDGLYDLKCPDIYLDDLTSLPKLRNDVLISHYKLKESILLHNVSELNLYPELTLSAVFSTGSSKFSNLFENPLGSISAAVTFPFVEYHKRKIDIDYASISILQHQKEYEHVLLEAVTDINSSLLNVYLAQEEHHLNKKHRNIAYLKLSNAQLAKNNGVMSHKDILSHRTKLIESEISMLDSYANTLTSLVDFCVSTNFAGCYGIKEGNNLK